MKDITELMNKKIFGNEDNLLDKRKNFNSIDGKEFKMPDIIFKKLVSLTTYYEIDDLSDIEKNWEKLSKQKMLPFDVMTWFGEQLMRQHKDNPRFLDNMKSNDNKLRTELDNIVGEKKTGLLGKLTGNKLKMPTVPSCVLYLNQVKLEKTNSFDGEFVKGAEYEITDIRGNKIKSVYLQAPDIVDAFDNEYVRENDTKNKLNETRLDARPAMVTCHALETKEPKLQILKVQSGGKAIEPLMPTIRM